MRETPWPERWSLSASGDVKLQVQVAAWVEFIPGRKGDKIPGLSFVLWAEYKMADAM